MNSGWPSDVAVERHVYRPVDYNGDESALLALADPERPGLCLRIADAGDGALVEWRIADSVDDDVVALVLEHADRLVSVGALSLSGLRRGDSCGREHDARRRYRCCHTPACAHDSLHSVICLVTV